MKEPITFFCIHCGHHVCVYGSYPEEAIKSLKICTGCGEENTDGLFVRIDSGIPHPPSSPTHADAPLPDSQMPSSEATTIALIW